MLCMVSDVSDVSHVVQFTVHAKGMFFFLLRDIMEVCNQYIWSSCERETFHQIQED